MGMLLSILGLIAGIVSLVCFVLVLVQMFQRGETTMGIVCIVLIFCFGIGGLVAFVYGWMKAGEWGIQNIMYAWTGAILVGFLFNGLSFALAPPQLDVGMVLNEAAFVLEAPQLFVNV